MNKRHYQHQRGGRGKPASTCSELLVEAAVLLSHRHEVKVRPARDCDVKVPRRGAKVARIAGGARRPS